ncbi:MAG: matrixin family metalloprotease [Actinomycetes bacterium]
MSRWGRTLAAVVLLSCLTACSAIADAVAPAGLRRGVDVPSRPAGTGPAPLGLPPMAPPGDGGYAFMATHQDGSPVTWDPCRAVHYVVRPAGEPAGARDLVRWAFGQLEKASGLHFVEDCDTDEAPAGQRPAYQRARYGDRWAPVLVAWSTPAESPLLSDAILGRAGPLPFGLTGKDDQRYVSGLAVFNGPALAQQLSTGDDNKARAVLLHELGHLVGLAHVQDPYQVMYDTNAYPLAAYRAGDRRGLQLLGKGRCFTDY